MEAEAVANETANMKKLVHISCFDDTQIFMNGAAA
jgi:hypothetical protein